MKRLLLASAMFLAGTAFVFLPASAQAVSTLVWVDVVVDPDTGEEYLENLVNIQNGGTYEVPFNIEKDTWIGFSDPSVFGVEGVLYISHPDSGTRERIVNIGGSSGVWRLAWKRAGDYELDVYEVEGSVSLLPVPWLERVFTYLFGEVAHAQEPGNFIETIRFTITEEGAVEKCCSSVVFLPGFQGSVLKTTSDTLWPPSLFGTENDLNALRLDENGDSLTNDIVVGGIVDTFHTVSVYDGFSSFMDDLVGGGAIAVWEPLAYDWRYTPQRIIEEGVTTPAGTINLVQRIENLAATSDTGQVTIVAHSNGGLVGKALIRALEAEGKAGLIDAFVMVGTPQLGTPQAIGGLLHGEGADFGPWFFKLVSKAEARSLAQNMESAYNLLPSRGYFDAVTDPTVVFDEDASYTDSWRALWGLAVGNFAEFFEFLTDAGDTRDDPAFSDVQSPETLRTDLLSNADAFHQELDIYDIPSSIRVVQVAGWGLDTIERIEYTEYEPYAFPYYVPVFTVEGDSTVVYPSAIASEGERYYFNLDSYGGGFEHVNILRADPIQEVISSVVNEESVQRTQFILEDKPTPSDASQKLLVAVHSPLTLGAYDSLGRFTGVDPANDPNWGIQFTKEEIPNSSYAQYGEGKYLLLPEGDGYTFEFESTGSGSATIEVQTISNDTPATAAVYSSVPVSETTQAQLVLGDDEQPELMLDKNGDGEVDQIISPDGTELSLNELVASLRQTIENLEIKDRLKKNLLKRIDRLEKKIEKKKARNAKVLEKFQRNIGKRADKGKINTADAGEILALLEALEVQVADISLDADILAQLRVKIESLDVKKRLKNNLLKRIGRLENQRAITKTLGNLSKKIMKKSERGRIEDADVQALLDLLRRIEGTL